MACELHGAGLSEDRPRFRRRRRTAPGANARRTRGRARPRRTTWARVAYGMNAVSRERSPVYAIVERATQAGAGCWAGRIVWRREVMHVCSARLSYSKRWRWRRWASDFSNVVSTATLRPGTSSLTLWVLPAERCRSLTGRCLMHAFGPRSGSRVRKGVATAAPDYGDRARWHSSAPQGRWPATRDRPRWLGSRDGESCPGPGQAGLTGPTKPTVEPPVARRHNVAPSVRSLRCIHFRVAAAGHHPV